MKAFANTNARDLKHAATVAAETARSGRAASFAGGGSDLLQLAKDRIVSPDVIVNLKTVKGLDGITSNRDITTIGGLTTLDAISRHDGVRRSFPVLAEAAESVATPQIRNVGTIAGNVCQRPWCWYFRNGFPCLKNGGTTCFSVVGENQFHAIFGGGPSYIVHPSDTAPALVALDARFRIAGPSGERVVPASEFFVLPLNNPAKENVLANDEVLASIEIPAPKAGTRSTYHKVLDREAWTHAVVSAAMVMEMDGPTCRSARVVLGGVAPIPWRLPEVEKLLTGQRMSPELAERAATAAVAGARPLQKNAYKIPLVKGIVRRTLSELARA
jgi:xanthine dehydrogenase YagS FAD-binding subunit